MPARAASGLEWVAQLSGQWEAVFQGSCSSGRAVSALWDCRALQGAGTGQGRAAVPSGALSQAELCSLRDRGVGEG